jgi:hypothetical protein
MSGRRSHMRFKFSNTCQGLLRVLHDVVIARREENGELTAVSGQTAAIGELLWLDLPGTDGDIDVKVRVLDSRPVVVDDTVRHQLRLEVVPAADSDHLLGLLTREVSVRMINLSHSGCLVECSHQIEAGTVGTMRLTIDGREYVENVQVMRCRRIEGAGDTYHVGVRFVWTSLSRQRSLSRAIGRSPHQVPAWLIGDDFRDTAR